MELDSLDLIYISFFVTGILFVLLGMYLKRRAAESDPNSPGGINDRIHGTTALGVGLCIILIVGVYTAYRKGFVDCKK